MTQTVVDDAITSRMSTRAFKPEPVPREVLMDLLRVASRAPSGTNTQPWKVYVLEGASRATLVDKVCAAHDAIRAEPALAADFREEYDYYPEKWVSPYIDRRRENGWGLYGLLGIGKGDKDKMHLQHIGAGPEEMLVCGMALGYADETDLVNTFHTPRVPVEEFTHWLK